MKFLPMYCCLLALLGAPRAATKIVGAWNSVEMLHSQGFPLDECSRLHGSWKQSHFNGRPDTSESRTFVITDISNSCQFKGTFDGGGFTHRITGTIGQKTDSGSITIERTDPTGCTNKLFGTINQVASSAWADGGLVWRLKSSEPKCGMGSNHTEERSWKRP
jgi:hypothetical protein